MRDLHVSAYSRTLAVSNSDTVTVMVGVDVRGGVAVGTGVEVGRGMDVGLTAGVVGIGSAVIIW